MLGTFCAEKDEVAITPYPACERREVLQRADLRCIRDAMAGRLSAEFVFPTQR
jgi:hypothetical protein